MAKFKNLQPWQINVIVRDHATNTAEQIAVKAKCTLAKVYEVCTDKKIKCLSPKQFKEGLNNERIAKIIVLPREKPIQNWQRPPAEYSNSSPFGIATQLHQGKMF